MYHFNQSIKLVCLTYSTPKFHLICLINQCVILSAKCLHDSSLFLLFNMVLALLLFLGCFLLASCGMNRTFTILFDMDIRNHRVLLVIDDGRRASFRF